MTEALQQLEQDYIKRTPGSKAAISRAAEFMPGGETRSVLHFSPYPLVIESAQGCILTDIDGHQYRDYVCDYGAALYGISFPARIYSTIRTMTV